MANNISDFWTIILAVFWKPVSSSPLLAEYISFYDHMHIRLAHYYYYEDLHIWLNEIVNIFLNGRLLSDAEKQTTLYFHLCIIDWQKNPEKINLFYWNEVVRIFIHGRLLHMYMKQKKKQLITTSLIGILSFLLLANIKRIFHQP